MRSGPFVLASLAAPSLPALRHPYLPPLAMKSSGWLNGGESALEATAFGISIIATLSGVPDSAVPDPERVRAEHIKGSSEGWLASNNACLRADPVQLTELIRHLVANHVALS